MVAPYDGKRFEDLDRDQLDARVLYHARRGLLELDIMLKRFLDQYYDALDTEERRTFLSLLQIPDLDLWHLIAGSIAPEPAYASLLTRLRQCHNDNNN